jgi:hypothetical protein
VTRKVPASMLPGPTAEESAKDDVRYAEAYSEVQPGDEERRSVRRVMSSSCSHPSPTKE